MQKIFVVLWHPRDDLSQAKIALKISEFIKNHVFNMLSDISGNLTANHRDMHKRPFGARGRVALYIYRANIPIANIPIANIQDCKVLPKRF
jgi:hypothetical protein